MYTMFTEDHGIEMADGVTLAVTLYRPVVDEPVPVLLEALPYRKDDNLERHHYEEFATRYGFAVCRVDVAVRDPQVDLPPTSIRSRSSTT